VFSDADGDQPGVLMRMIDWVRGAGMEVVAAVNCKGFMDVHATPDTVRPWCEKQNTSPAMTTSMADGTKMNLENAVIANATGLLPEVRGMHGITTDLAHALNDCARTFRRHGVVDYTLGGDFGGGVFVIGYSRDPAVQPYLKYLKMGDGPNYLFFRPYHLCHLETPMSIADAVLDGEATIAPLGPPLVEVIAYAKRDLRAGEPLDGIGGYTMYGRIDTRARCRGMLPIGMANGARMIRSVRQDEPILVDAVQLGDDPLLMSLREQQECLLQVA
jgi:predicted homoserine dehydrogenase-like protein